MDLLWQYTVPVKSLDTPTHSRVFLYFYYFLLCSATEIGLVDKGKGWDQLKSGKLRGDPSTYTTLMEMLVL
jgi:hypothetical protein